MASRTFLPGFGGREGSEKKPLQNRDYYKTLIEGKQEPTLLVDMNGDIMLFNKPARELTGFSGDEPQHFHVREIFMTMRNNANPFDTTQLREFSGTMFMRDSGHYLFPVFIEFMEIGGQKFLASFHSVTEEGKEVNEENPVGSFRHEPLPSVRPIQSSGTGSDWPVEFEHQVRNVVNNILGFGSILQKETSFSKEEPIAGYLDSILQNGERLKKLLNRSGNPDSESYEVTLAPFRVFNVIQKSMILLEALARHHQVMVEADPTGDEEIVSDEILLQSIFIFFLEKAILYTRKEKVRILISHDPDGKSLLVSFEDLGQDIPQEVSHFIRRETSQPSYDTENPVLLMHPGIRTMLKTLNLIAGKVSITAVSGGGQNAVIRLPLTLGAENGAGQGEMEEKMRQHDLKILVVEDDKINSKILSKVLEGISTVSVAFSGNEALNIIENLYSMGSLFNVVIMDIGLPYPWDGISLKEEIERRWPEYRKVHFLAQTAYSSKNYTERISAGHFQGHLLKPVNPKDILRFIYHVYH